MDSLEVDRLVKQLTAGFDALQEEYQKLHGQNQTLERKLAAAREQYNELAKLYGAVRPATPSLSLASTPGQANDETLAPDSLPEMLDNNTPGESNDAASKVRSAIAAANQLRLGLPTVIESTSHGVKIWSGPSADRPECSSSMMPSISESPLEQDFTVEGKPSKLGCPFASMANKKLSSHAASVLSRYNQSRSVGAHGSVAASSSPAIHTSRINGRDSFSQRRSRRASFVDPIKAEICGLSDHDAPEAEPSQPEPVPSKPPTVKTDVENAEVGVCPIRFLDQHSPEEVATYFEKHKHELPRSHEVCVMRYQSNDEQIKELDAKYGNLVSMIQGLGQKHKDYLPEEPDEAEGQHPEDALDYVKVRKWASSVSAQAPDADADEAAESEEERQPHFDRPLRDIRVGESPGRPWGVQVPLHYLEQGDAASGTSSKPANIATAAPPDAPPAAEAQSAPAGRPAGKCPFGHGAAVNPATAPKPAINVTSKAPDVKPGPDPAQIRPLAAGDPSATTSSKVSPTVFNGPVFIGYSPEDAVKFLKESGYRMSQQ